MVNQTKPLKKYSNRSRLLDILGELTTPLGGEEISQRLNISRVAVWKIIQQLKEDGYTIESNKKGYTLKDRPSSFNVEKIPLEGKVYHYRQVPSTMEISRDIPQEEQEEILVIAESQDSGRDRNNQRWESLPGGLYLTYRKSCSIPLAWHSRISVLFLLKLTSHLQGLAIPALYKWPNEIVLDGKKLGGLLLEMQTSGDKITEMNLGLGIHVNDEIEDGHTSTSLKHYSQSPWDIEELTAQISPMLSSLEQEITQEDWMPIHGDGVILKGMGTFQSPWEGSFTGQVLGVTNRGALSLMQENKIREIHMGEIIHWKLIEPYKLGEKKNGKNR